MSFGSVNTPSAWLVSVKQKLTELAARISSAEKMLTGLEKLSGTTAPTPQVTAKVGQIYINTATGEEWKCIAVNSSGTAWEKLPKTGFSLTAANIGAVPDTRKVNNKPLSADISLTAEDVGARPSDWMPTAADVGARPSTWTPTAADVGARPSTWTPTAADVGAKASNWTPFHIGANAPTDTTQLWIDTTAGGVLKYYDGSAWMATAASGGTQAASGKSFYVGTSAPSDANQLWIDTTADTGVLKYYNGAAWAPVPVAWG